MLDIEELMLIEEIVKVVFVFKQLKMKLKVDLVEDFLLWMLFVVQEKKIKEEVVSIDIVFVFL